MNIAGKYPQCPKCLKYSLERTSTITLKGICLRCYDCYTSLIWREEIRGSVNGVKCNWAVGEIDI